ncbi:MAG: hypothetical protein Fur0032_01480 [Terrimicrobiaceae bacterium]
MKQILRVLVPAAFFLGLVWVVAGWMPAAQVDKQTSRLLRAAGDRDWKTVGQLVSRHYRDPWGQDKESAIKLAAEAGRHFFALVITPSGEPTVTADGDKTLWKGRLAFGGRGTALGEAMLSRTSEFREDFVFAWRRESWKPWDWKLVSVNQPELNINPQWMP